MSNVGLPPEKRIKSFCEEAWRYEANLLSLVRAIFREQATLVSVTKVDYTYNNWNQKIPDTRWLVIYEHTETVSWESLT